MVKPVGLWIRTPNDPMLRECRFCIHKTRQGIEIQDDGEIIFCCSRCMYHDSIITRYQLQNYMEILHHYDNLAILSSPEEETSGMQVLSDVIILALIFHFECSYPAITDDQITFLSFSFADIILHEPENQLPGFSDLLQLLGDLYFSSFADLDVSSYYPTLCMVHHQMCIYNKYGCTRACSDRYQHLRRHAMHKIYSL